VSRTKLNCVCGGIFIEYVMLTLCVCINTKLLRAFIHEKLFKKCEYLVNKNYILKPFFYFLLSGRGTFFDKFCKAIIFTMCCIVIYVVLYIHAYILKFYLFNNLFCF
jgi:hypothetical protein